MVTDVEHTLAGPHACMPEADVMYMLHSCCIINAGNVPCLLLHNDSSQLHLVLTPWSLGVVDNLQAATVACCQSCLAC